MVFDLCLPHFYTTAHCNKLCADGYDVTNLVSADPAVRRRGCKLEYFVRPPLQVTLKFGFQVDLCRIDVELWPLGMDRQTCRKLEISTSSADLAQPERSDRLDRQTNFKLVARCQLGEETTICFQRANFRPRPPFVSAAPQPPHGCHQEALWSRGADSLCAVTRLRVTVPCGGAATALGFKTLRVWAQPARCCHPQEVERIRGVHQRNQRRAKPPELPAASVRPTAKPELTVSVPEEFLDPITQEVMTLPVLLPSGVSVDTSTLDEYQRREAVWGRAPSDPFTGVCFSASSRPLPNPPLKSRIDRFLLREGAARSDGAVGGAAGAENPRASRLVGEESASGDGKDSDEAPTEEPASKKQRIETQESQSERTSDSLDDALLLVLKGRPCFTSKRETAEPPAGRRFCSACSSAVSAYSPLAAVYRLACGHLLCRRCLLSFPGASSSIACPTCRSSSLRVAIVRVHQ